MVFTHRLTKMVKIMTFTFIMGTLNPTKDIFMFRISAKASHT